MPKRKIKKHELTRPDEFEAKGYEAIHWAVEAWRRVRARPGLSLQVSGACVALLALAAGGWAWRSHREAQAAERFFSIVRDFQSMQERAGAAREPQPAGEAGGQGDAWVNESAAVAGEMERFLSAGGATGRLECEALFLLGNVKLRRGEPKQASEWLERFDREADQKDPLRPLAWVSLGYAYEALDDVERAAEWFRKAADAAGAGAPEAMLGQARNLVALGRTDDARRAYEGYIAKQGDSRGAALARAELARLPAPAAPTPPAS